MVKMKFKPKSPLELFAYKVQNLLVENFPQSFFVGGTVRDMLLKKEMKDVDIATVATPTQVVDLLNKYFFKYNVGYQRMGVIVVTEGDMHVTVSTFRKDLPAQNRYPEVVFTKDIKVDAKRRDFTINALYFQPNTGAILDFHKGQKDIQEKKIRFIGDAKKRIAEDPLRIIRALRFALTLHFKIEKKTLVAIKNSFDKTSQLTESRIQKEFEKLVTEKSKKFLKEVINNKKTLDKYF